MIIRQLTVKNLTADAFFLSFVFLIYELITKTFHIARF